MPTVKQDWGALKGELEAGVKDILGRMIDGTVEDLEGPIKEIGSSLLLAVKRRRWDLVDASKDQLALIAIEKGLILQYEAEGLLEKMLGMGLDMLVKGAIGGLGSLTVTP